MKPTEALWEEHEAMRTKLALLEGLLPLAGGAQFPMREIVYSIARRLRCHTEKEEALVTELQGMWERSPQEAFVWPLLDEHQDHRVTATLLLKLLADPNRSLGWFDMCASHLIESMRAHMRREELTMFSLVDRTLVDETQCGAAMRRLRAIDRHHYPVGECHSQDPEDTGHTITMRIVMRRGGYDELEQAAC